MPTFSNLVFISQIDSLVSVLATQEFVSWFQCSMGMSLIKQVLTLQTNTSVATSLGTYFLSQITTIFLDMLNVYRYVFVGLIYLFIYF